MCKWFKAIREWFIQQWAFQLIVPEFKARHICWTYEAMLDWVECYEGQGTQAIAIMPARSDWPRDSMYNVVML